MGIDGAYPPLSKAALGSVWGVGLSCVRHKGLLFVTVHRQGTAQLLGAQMKQHRLMGVMGK